VKKKGLLILFFALLICCTSAAQEVLAADSIQTDTLKIDSLKTDSLKKSNAIEAPIDAHATDSIIMTLEGQNMLYLFGKATVKQETRNLDAEFIKMNADSSLLYANFGIDSIGDKFGFPVYTEGDQRYEMEKVWFNFKSKKMLVEEVITQQGEGYMTANRTKKVNETDMFLQDGKYTTCDEHEHPHWYFSFTKGRLKKGKNVVVGPTYLVVEDIPLPVAVPFGFFPFNKDYSSGILMPTFDDEMTRGFSLRNGGYYFAFSDYVDLALTGEIYTKGSWGLNAVSRYVKKYKYRGNVDAGYIVTITGDKDTKDLPGSDYSKKKDFKLNWSHSQDQKANPYLNFSANVRFTTSTYNRNNINELYSSNFTDNNKSSTVQLTYRHPTQPISITSNASVSQTLRDTSLSVSFPNMTFTVSQIYPFKRSEQIGDARWYEKIYLSYTGVLKNSIDNVKESEFFKKNILNDWQNGMTHSIPLSASFTAFKYISINPSINYNEYWYTKKLVQDYSAADRRVMPVDTAHGFYRVYNYSASISANTKLYGMYKPLPMLGKWTKGVVVRHMVTPSVSFSGAPDFSDPRYGSYYDIEYADPNDPTRIISNRYSYFQGQIGGGGSSGKSGSLRFSIDNNLEAKIPIADTDSTRKISIIDNFGVSTSYNFLLDSLNWADRDVALRFKLFGRQLSFNTQFLTYKFDENGRKINQMRPGLGRFTGTQAGYSYSLNNTNVTKFFNRLFGREDRSTPDKTKTQDNLLDGEDFEDYEEDFEETEESEQPEEPTSLRKKKQTLGQYDEDGYLMQTVPWNLGFNYSLSYRMNTADFDKEKREYRYKVSQTLGIQGSITPAKGWNFNFSSSYDFDNKKFAYLQCSISRDMHCWTMSASFMPVGPYQSYNFLIAVKASILKDLKYQQSNNYRDAKSWE
jgi:lipopolysaccharide assembly outer membrane protein LptD (OstA)